ncbi:hypothetical protein BH11PAT2_BH11PAT2_08230 [soil metagenome]
MFKLSTGPSQHSRTRFLGVVAILVVLISIALYAFVPVHGVTAWKQAMNVYELRGVIVTPFGAETVTPYSFGMNGLKKVSISAAPGVLEEYAQGGSTHVVLTKVATSAENDVWLLGSPAKKISNESGPKKWVAVSSDGSLVAYSVATTMATSSIAAWSVELVNLKTNKSSSLGVGIAPQFFTRAGKQYLLSTSVGTVNVTDLDKNTNVATPLGLTDTLFSYARVSPDGNHIALRDAATRLYSIYTMEQPAGDLSFKIVSTKNKLLTDDDILLTNTSWYGLRFLPRNGTVVVEATKTSYDASSEGGVLYSFASTEPYHFISSTPL